MTIGPKAAQKQLRTALALGVDRAVQVGTEVRVESLAAVKLVDEERPRLVILGKQAIDFERTRPARCWRHSPAASRYLRLRDRGRGRQGPGHSRDLVKSDDGLKVITVRSIGFDDAWSVRRCG